MNKNELETENASLREQLSAALALAKKHEDDLKGVTWDYKTAAADRDYYARQLSENSQAWTKKYLQLEEKSGKAMNNLAKASMDALALQRDKYEARVKAVVNEGKLCIEMAKSDTLAYAFEHVTEKLAAKNS